MDAVDDPPELSGYVPHEEHRPLRSPMVVRVMRVAIVLGVIGLIVPGLVGTIALQNRNAQFLCVQRVGSQDFGAEAIARFEVLGPAGPGWYCYARAFDGREVRIGSLGLIPG